MITLQCQLELSKNDKELLLTLMRKFSSCMRYAYNRLLEGKTRKDLKKQLQHIFNINSRYVDDAIMKAQSIINLCKETNQNPTKIIFGGRENFKKLQQNHLQGKKREKLKQNEYTIAKLEEKKEELREYINKETNKYKQRPIKEEIKRINKDIRMLIKNLNSEPETRQQGNQRKEPVREEERSSYKLWRVVKVALGIPILGKSFSRDFSLLREFLVDWDRVSRRLAPVLGAGAMVSQNTASRSMANLKMAEYK